MKKLAILLFSITAFLTYSCNNETNEPYTVSGVVVNNVGVGLEGIKISYNDSSYTLSDENGNWTINNLTGIYSLKAIDSNYHFTPLEILVSEAANELTFTGNRIVSNNELQIINWFNAQQLPNGLLASVENGNIISLYDNALAAMVFILNNDFEKAENIFDFFNSRIDAELKNGVGGFSQFRDANGIPSNHRWMGDNAWLLLAINNYKAITGNDEYDLLANEISDWLIGLQDTDGGLFAGYDAGGNLLNYKVTEGNLDAFAAIDGYENFHIELLNFLEVDRWNANEKVLKAWPGNPDYLYALDNFSWGYCAFEDFPVSTLSEADRFITSQTATINGVQLTGYDIDEDKDAVFVEGSGQMALAFNLASQTIEADYYLEEIEKILTSSETHENAAGFPYASNIGTGYGNAPYWIGADTEIAISPGAWYLFAKYNFNPFNIGHDKNIPINDKFWLN